MSFSPRFFFHELTPRTLKKCLRLLTEHNTEWLLRQRTMGREIVGIYDSGVKYAAENGANDEHWCDIPTVLSRGAADCEDLACWRAAELRVQGHPNARAVVMTSRLPNNIRGHHILVECDGTIEDPSVVLGMPGPRGRKAFFPGRLQQ